MFDGQSEVTYEEFRMKKIAILGGGISALTAALELTQQPDWKQNYEVTVYQMGWRLGGKAASSRNEQKGLRIEEHGLHIWLGFYENAFEVMNRCYAELKRPPEHPLATVSDAFKPQSFVVLEEQLDTGWDHWCVEFPTNDSLPGNGMKLPTLWDYLEMAAEWIHEGLMAHPEFQDPKYQDVSVGIKPPWWDETWKQLSTQAEIDVLGFGAALSGMAVKTAAALGPDANTHSAADHQAFHWFLQRLSIWLQGVFEDIKDNTLLRRTWIPIDLMTSVARGVLADGLIYNGLDAVDQYEFRDWLRKHGASDISLSSAWLRGAYDLAFSFVSGDPTKPNIAAGVAIRALFRMTFTYKGAVLWKMQAGMGETVVTPLYQVLQDRGVNFEFFQRIDQLRLSADGTNIDQIEIGVQATPRADYSPLVERCGLECWPGTPLFEQLTEGDALKASGENLESHWTAWKDVGKRTLARGTDFDSVILAIPIAALPTIVSDIVAKDDKWKDMFQGVRTNQTQGFQLWLNKNLTDSGWPYASPVLGAYVEPLDTWSDMTHLLKAENWAGATVPQQLAYICGVLQDADVIPDSTATGFPREQNDRVFAAMKAYVQKNALYLWPKFANADGTGTFDWNSLFTTDGSSNEDRLSWQYWRANIDPSERYVLAVADSTRHRLRVDETGLNNLVITGDWVRNGLNTPGCIESAVLSGKQAARALLQTQQTFPGETDFPTA
jgi:uncharacterized protein with NAD-binding domain and iron-sulfur cluster